MSKQLLRYCRIIEHMRANPAKKGRQSGAATVTRGNRLTEEQICQALILHQKRGYGYSKLAELFGVSKSQRAKGQRGENEAAKKLTELLGTIVQRNLGQERDGGHDITIGSTAGDIEMEVKRQERASLHTWLNQAEENAGSGSLLAVMWRPSRREWVVCMPLEDWAALVREAQTTCLPSRDWVGEPRVDIK